MQREIHRLQEQVQGQNASRQSSTESQTSIPVTAREIAVSTPPIQPIQVPVASSRDVLRTRPQPRVLEDLELPSDKVESLFSLYDMDYPSRVDLHFSNCSLQIFYQTQPLPAHHRRAPTGLVL